MQNEICYAPDEQLPEITIMMAVYNEEKVIREKLESVFNSDYPLDKLEFLIGSDNSTDKTHEIIAEFQAKYPALQLTVFKNRQGKANILNQLEKNAKGDVYLFTDANVFFEKNTIFQLVKHFKNEKISQVCARFINKGISDAGISSQEKGYIARETIIKYQEGILWGTMMGAFGGCHAVRAVDFVPNPPAFFMEDFYISMHLMAKGKQAILELDAVVYEDVPDKIQEEFKRKVRISIGNFQNLSVFYKVLFPPFNGLAFSFLSHKVLRWLGPLWLILMWLSSAVLAFSGAYCWNIVFGLITLAFIGLPIADKFLQKIGIHISIIRYGAYFIAMNVALLQGFIKFAKGVQSNVWQPTERKV